MKNERKKKAVQKILCVALAAAMLGVYAETALPMYTGTGVVAKAATLMDVEAADDYEWEENEDGSVTITGYTGNGGDVVIPSKIDGKSVTSIDVFAFDGCTGLTSVTIPDSVTSIGYYAFGGCTGLTSVIIPGSVTTIEPFVFSNCTGLTSVTIPDGVTSIDSLAFYNCTGLTSVTVPDSVTSISDDTFSGCTGLTEINVGQNNESYTSEDGVLFDKNKTTLILYPAGKKGAYTIPDSVTEIDPSAFKDCAGLTDITIPDSVISIGDFAFSGCTGLTNVIIPDSVTSISNDAFLSCTGLTSVTIPDSVTSIGDCAFDGCTGLTSVTIPDSVISIGVFAFDGCTGLTSVTIPDSVTDIGRSAFFGCTGLTDVTIPDSVTSISSLAFYNCTGLTNITIPASVIEIGSVAFYGCDNITIHGYKNSYAETYANKNGITFAAIDVETADDYEWEENEDGSVTITGYTGNGGDVVIPSKIDGKSVTSIGNYAFEGCKGLTSVTIPGSVTKIGNWAFFGCTGLTDVKISDSVTEIGMSAFYGCTGLTGITIPDSVTNIGMGAFFGCTGLTSIDVDKNNENYLSEGGIVFNKDKSVLVLYPVGRKGDYTIPESVTEIGTSAFVACTGLTSITIPDNVTKIGMGAFAGCSGLTSVMIPDSVTEIGAEAFSYCTGLTSIDVDKNNENYLSENGVLFNKDKTSLIAYPGGKNGAYTVPGSVTEIGAGAFADCTGLTSITVPDSVTSIGDYAFSHCTGLTNITIPASVTEISDGIFAGCDDIVIFGYSGSYAETYANENELAFVAIDADYEWEENEDGSVTITGYTGNGGDVVIPSEIDGKSVTSIDDWAFFGCTGLTSVIIPNSVTSINAYAFGSCTGLTDVTIPDSVTSIGSLAFYNCTGLTSVTIPDSVTSIGDEAFLSCTGLTVISVDKNNESYTSEDGVLFNKNKAVLVAYPGGKKGAYTIPGSVTSICDAAFTACTGLTVISVDKNNESYTSEDGVLFDKNKTILITYPAGKKGAYTIPGSVTSICDAAFTACTGLTDVTIPDSVTKIGAGAFADCTGLTSVKIGKGVTSIGAYAFDGCKELTIYGYKNSYAETYAKDNDIPFVAIEEPIVTPAEITLNTTRTWMGRGETYQISATVSPNNAADKSITWTSSNNNIATVSNGKVTAKKDGTVTITAKTSNGKIAECKITVQPPASKITLNKSTLYLGIGETFQLTSSVQSGTASAKRAFASSDNSICYTSGKGLLTAKKAGTVYVTVKTFNGKTAQCKVVVQPPASKITLNKSTLYLGIGETFQLTSSVQSGTASTKRAFASSDNSICYTSGNGLLTAKKAGTVYVTVKTFNGKTAQCKVVVQPPASKITLNKSTLYLGIGETFQLTSSVQSGTASTKRAFASSDNSICYTSGNGLLTAKKAGTVYVTVKTFNGKTAQCKVVVQPPAKAVHISKSWLTLHVGQQFQLSSWVEAGTASTKRAWSSSDNSTVYTSGNGLLTAKKEGIAYITVKTFNGVSETLKVKVIK